MRRKGKKPNLSDPIREIHHRVKNNLQMIASILRLQMRREESVAAQSALASAVNRIMGMVQVHDLLAQDQKRHINLRELLVRLMELNTDTFLMPGQTIRTSVRGENVWLNAERALSLGLVANELIINAFKHAFRRREEGKLVAQIETLTDVLSILIQDDGCGLPPEFNLTGSSSLGLRIVNSVVEDDLHGRLSLTTQNGTRVEISIPLGEVLDI